MTMGVLLCFFFFFSFFLTASSKKTAVSELQWANISSEVRLQVNDNSLVVLDNGIVQVTLSKPGGNVLGIKYNGIENVLEPLNKDDDRGYWDVVWNAPGDPNIFDRLEATNFRMISADKDHVEVSFTKAWNPSVGKDTVPLNVDKRYVLRRGCSGVYLYTILERLEGWPDVDMDQIRVVFKLQENKFHYMAISDDRQRVMPTPEDRTTGQPLAYPEAVLLTNPSNPKLKGEVDDKYQYSSEDEGNNVHGWISEDPPVGFWMITPSNEFRAGGPIKQDLTSHVGPIVLNMFTSTHYIGKDLNTAYRNGEPWKKVFGPVYVYLNSAQPTENHRLQLWQDAKKQMSKEVKSWPYSFPQSEDFPSPRQRGSVAGQLVVRDRYINEKLLYGGSAYVGLAAPGKAGSWQTEAKSYQFWTKADRLGRFLIRNVRTGRYNLYSWVPGIIGDYKYGFDITIIPGSKINLNILVYEPPRQGPTLWEIGIPDRSAAEYFVPETYPCLMNKLYSNLPKQKFRQYGLWDRYSDLYPKGDLIYNVGSSSYMKDWFFAHVTRHRGDSTYQSTTWQIKFELEFVNHNGVYTLQLALASATGSEVQVRINYPGAIRPLFTTGLVGSDNAIARHGIHGLYWLYSISIPNDQLFNGENTIYLTQSRCDGPFRGVMYDYIRLEGPGDT